MPASMVWKVGLLGWAMIGASALAAESVPASIRACAAITDSLQRLVCYDKEVARFPEPAAAKTGPKTAASPAAVASTAPTAPAAATPPPAAAAPAAAGTNTAPAANTTAATGKSTAQAAAASPAKSSGDISARIVSIDHQPNEMVLHLDNGQVWQQTQSVSGDLSLREGDTVKIGKHLGSWLLSGPHVSSMKVRQIS
jgi:hypothetical protein